MAQTGNTRRWQHWKASAALPQPRAAITGPDTKCQVAAVTAKGCKPRVLIQARSQSSFAWPASYLPANYLHKLGYSHAAPARLGLRATYRSWVVVTLRLACNSLLPHMLNLTHGKGMCFFNACTTHGTQACTNTYAQMPMLPTKARGLNENAASQAVQQGVHVPDGQSDADTPQPVELLQA